MKNKDFVAKRKILKQPQFKLNDQFASVLCAWQRFLLVYKQFGLLYKLSEIFLFTHPNINTICRAGGVSLIIFKHNGIVSMRRHDLPRYAFFLLHTRATAFINRQKKWPKWDEKFHQVLPKDLLSGFFLHSAKNRSCTQFKLLYSRESDISQFRREMHLKDFFWRLLWMSSRQQERLSHVCMVDRNIIGSF